MVSHIFRKALRIQADETKKAGYLIAFFFAVGFYFTFLGSISISIFDIRFGANYLPYILFIFPALNLLFSFAYIKILTKIDKRKLFAYFMLFVLAAHAFNFFIINGAFSSKVFFAVLLLLSLLVNEKLYFISMTVVQDVVDIESIKRMLPLSTCAFTIASMAGAFFIGRFAESISVKLLFLISGFFIFFIAYFANIILKRYRTVPEDLSGAGEDSLKRTIGYIRGNSFLYVLILAAIAVDVTYNINDYLYNVIASSAIPDEARFVSFVGTTETYRYILTLAVDLFLFTWLVTRFGSLNAVKMVFLNAVIGTVILIYGSSHIYLVMSSKIIFTVLVMLLSYSLMQILYQPVQQKYREKVIIIADTVVIMAGSLIGGLATLMHSFGYLSSTVINIASAAAAVIMLVIWQVRQKGFIRVIESSMNGADSLDAGRLFGKLGLLGLMPHISQKALQGKPHERLLMLDLLKRADFNGREKLLKDIFKGSGLEIRMKLIDMAFEGSVPFGVLTESSGELAGDPQAMQHLIYRAFQNYRQAKEKGVIQGFDRIRDSIDKTCLEPLQRLMFEYLYEGERDKYQLIIQQLAGSKKSSELGILLKMMANFIGIEDDANRSALMSIMLDLKGYQGLLEDTAELCSAYDRDMGMVYLKEVYSGYCQKGVVQSVCSYYGAKTVIDNLGESDMLIPKIYVLHAATRLEQGRPEDYMGVCGEVKERLRQLVTEKLKIQASGHILGKLLCDEAEKLIASVTAGLLEFLFACCRIPEVAHLERHLQSRDGKKLILEIVRNSLPLRESKELLPILEERLEIPDPRFIYSALNAGGMHQMLSNLYMVLGGESMEEQFGREAERVAILKKTAVFKNLDMESLYELIRIGEFASFSDGETVLRKNEEGDKLYVVIEGQAGTYLEETVGHFSVAGPGEMFGEEDVMERSPRLSTVRSLGRTVFFRIDGDEFVSLARTNNELAFSLLEVLAGKLRSDMRADR